jgi:hypothetical protein
MTKSDSKRTYHLVVALTLFMLHLGTIAVESRGSGRTIGREDYYDSKTCERW